MFHHYRKSHAFEKISQSKADAFYTSRLGDCVVTRYDSNAGNDLSYQRKDIDLTIAWKDKEFKISEKFRNTDYGDFLIEIYSKYPNVKGWMHYSEADYISYFTKKFVYFINKMTLTKWYNGEKMDERYRSAIEQFHKKNLQKSASIKISINTLNGTPIDLYLIQAYNKTGYTEWYTISIAITWEDLREQGIQIKRYVI